MQEPAFSDDLKERISSGGEVVPSLPKNLLKKRVPNDLRPSFKKSFVLHFSVLFIFLLYWVYSKFWVTDLEQSQVLKEKQALRSAIRVDIVDLPSLKLSEMHSIDLTQESAPNAKPAMPEEPIKKEKEISETAMVDRTQKAAESDKVKEPKRKDEKQDRLKSLQDSLRAEQKRKELIAGISKNRPVLAGNIVSEGYSLTGDIATDKEAFSGKVQAHVVRNFKVPSWMNSSKLKAEILVKVAPDGRLVSFSLIKSSGDSEFDSAASKAIEKSDPFPAPPESLKRVFLEEGVVCGFP